MHVLNRLITALKVGITDESISFAEICIIASDFRNGEQLSKAGKGLIQDLFIRHAVQISNEEFRADTTRTSSTFPLHALVR